LLEIWRQGRAIRYIFFKKTFAMIMISGIKQFLHAVGEFSAGVSGHEN